jgi:hypothetical protein
MHSSDIGDLIGSNSPQSGADGQITIMPGHEEKNHVSVVVRPSCVSFLVYPEVRAKFVQSVSNRALDTGWIAERKHQEI